MDGLARWVLVFDYEYWHEDTSEMRKAELPATLEAIRSGLGRPVLRTGRKVSVEWIDSTGVLKREALSQPARARSQATQGGNR